jgi:hypothetical protein
MDSTQRKRLSVTIILDQFRYSVTNKFGVGRCIIREAVIQQLRLHERDGSRCVGRVLSKLVA